MTTIDLSTFEVDDSVTLTSAAEKLKALRKLKEETLKPLEATLVAFLVDVLPGGGMHIGSLGFYEGHRGKSKTRTDGKRLAHVVAARTADEVVDPETGEYPPLGVVCAKVADELMACAGIDNASHSWRSGELKKRGITLSQFTTSEPGNPSVVIRETGA